MVRLRKFYDLVSRNATVLLISEDEAVEFYRGSLRNIPDEFDNWVVADFSMAYNGAITFKLEVNA